MKKLCILVRTIGPYHHARFNALSNVFKVCVFETRPKIGEYDWDNSILEKAYYTLCKNLDSNKKTTKKSIITFLNEIKPDFIITHGWADYEYLVAVQFAKKNRILVCTLSDSTLQDYKRNPIKELLKRNIANCFDGYLAAGTRSIEYLHNLGINNNILTPCDVVDNDYFERKTEALRIGKEKISIGLPNNYILCVSRFIPKKNISTLLLAYSEVVNINTRFKYSLVIVGSGPLKDELEEQINDLKISDKVTIHNFAQYDQLPSYYAKASAVIVPSTSDQWGLVVNEAMACGLPIFVSKNCGCAIDLVKNRMNGIIFKPEKEEICDTLNEFNNLSDSILIEYGKLSRKIIEQYSIDKFVQAVDNIAKCKANKINLLQKTLIAILTN